MSQKKTGANLPGGLSVDKIRSMGKSGNLYALRTKKQLMHIRVTPTGLIRVVKERIKK